MHRCLRWLLAGLLTLAAAAGAAAQDTEAAQENPRKVADAISKEAGRQKLSPSIPIPQMPGN